ASASAARRALSRSKQANRVSLSLTSRQASSAVGRSAERAVAASVTPVSSAIKRQRQAPAERPEGGGLTAAPRAGPLACSSRRWQSSLLAPDRVRAASERGSRYRR